MSKISDLTFGNINIEKLTFHCSKCPIDIEVNIEKKVKGKNSNI